MYLCVTVYTVMLCICVIYQSVLWKTSRYSLSCLNSFPFVSLNGACSAITLCSRQSHLSSIQLSEKIDVTKKNLLLLWKQAVHQK